MPGRSTTLQHHLFAHTLEACELLRCKPLRLAGAEHAPNSLPVRGLTQRRAARATNARFVESIADTMTKSEFGFNLLLKGVKDDLQTRTQNIEHATRLTRTKVSLKIHMAIIMAERVGVPESRSGISNGQSGILVCPSFGGGILIGPELTL